MQLVLDMEFAITTLSTTAISEQLWCRYWLISTKINSVFGKQMKSMLYDFMISVANHSIAEWTAEKLNIDIVFEPGDSDSDVEVRMMGRWLAYHASQVRRGEDKVITYQELRKILRRFGYDLVNPSSARIRIVKTNRDGTLTNIHSVYYPGEAREVSLGAIKSIRARCKLREEDGVDSDSFYRNALQVSEFVNRHRLVLRRLADA